MALDLPDTHLIAIDRDGSLAGLLWGFEDRDAETAAACYGLGQVTARTPSADEARRWYAYFEALRNPPIEFMTYVPAETWAPDAGLLIRRRPKPAAAVTATCVRS